MFSLYCRAARNEHLPSRVQNIFNRRLESHGRDAQIAFASAARQGSEAGNDFGVANLGIPVGQVRFLIRPTQTPEVQAVVVGVPNSEVRAHLDRLLSVMTAVATLVVAASTWIAYLLAKDGEEVVALDITRAKTELGCAPKYGLEDAIQDYAQWLHKVLS